ncbi:MAG: acyl-CoA-binding protein [Candidatus Promineifilaceae bacterium]|nr:acyl-CoA-binding protein [Candidatus Promineifilaceae bacterium]
MNADDLQTRFEQAAEDVQRLPAKPDNKILLQLYALYKQATQGSVSGNRPGFTNPVGRAKHDAWARLRGKSRAEAMEEYIALVERLEAGP